MKGNVDENVQIGKPEKTPLIQQFFNISTDSQMEWFKFKRSVVKVKVSKYLG